jgi:hypothetical protein
MLNYVTYNNRQYIDRVWAVFETIGLRYTIISRSRNISLFLISRNEELERKCNKISRYQISQSNQGLPFFDWLCINGLKSYNELFDKKSIVVSIQSIKKILKDHCRYNIILNGYLLFDFKICWQIDHSLVSPFRL